MDAVTCGVNTLQQIHSLRWWVARHHFTQRCTHLIEMSGQSKGGAGKEKLKISCDCGFCFILAEPHLWILYH